MSHMFVYMALKITTDWHFICVCVLFSWKSAREEEIIKVLCLWSLLHLGSGTESFKSTASWLHKIPCFTGVDLDATELHCAWIHLRSFWSVMITLLWSNFFCKEKKTFFFSKLSVRYELADVQNVNVFFFLQNVISERKCCHVAAAVLKGSKTDMNILHQSDWEYLN